MCQVMSSQCHVMFYEPLVVVVTVEQEAQQCIDCCCSPLRYLFKGGRHFCHSYYLALVIQAVPGFVPLRARLCTNL